MGADCAARGHSARLTTITAPAVELAKPHLDVGLFARATDPQLAFWRDAVGLPYDHVLKLGAGIHQHRFDMNGSVLKVNHSRAALEEAHPSGITGLRIASAGTRTPRSLSDPDGNGVTLVPMGHDGVTGIGIELRVNNRDAHQRFWCQSCTSRRRHLTSTCAATPASSSAKKARSNARTAGAATVGAI